MLALVLLCTALLRLPAFQWRVLSDDEAIYDAMGSVIAGGGVMYRDTVDHKPPGLAYTYAACRWLARDAADPAALALHLVHAVGLLAVLLTALALFAIGRRVLDDRAALWAAALYGIASAAMQPVDGLAVNGELLMNLPLAASALCAICATRQHGLRRVALDLLAGALCAIAILYKYQAGLIGLALPLLLLDTPRPRHPLRALFVRGLSWLAGLLLPFAAVALYFRDRGVLDDALFWGIGFNRDYLAQGPGLLWSLERLGIQLGGVVAPSIVLYVAGLRALFTFARNPGEPKSARAFLFAWTLLSLLAVGLGGRFFGHYFLQAELPLSLLAAAPVGRFFSRVPVRAGFFLFAPAIAFATIAAQPTLCRSIFNGGDPDYETAGRFAAEITRPTDTIWVWGNVPQIYYFAERLQGTRFSFCNYLTGLSPATPSEYDVNSDPKKDRVRGALEMAISDLDSQRPLLILDTAENDIKHYGRFPLRDFPALWDYMAKHYSRGETVAKVVFYRRFD